MLHKMNVNKLKTMNTGKCKSTHKSYELLRTGAVTGFRGRLLTGDTNHKSISKLTLLSVRPTISYLPTCSTLPPTATINLKLLSGQRNTCVNDPPRIAVSGMARN